MPPHHHAVLSVNFGYHDNIIIEKKPAGAIHLLEIRTFNSYWDKFTIQPLSPAIYVWSYSLKSSNQNIEEGSNSSRNRVERCITLKIYNILYQKFPKLIRFDKHFEIFFHTR